MPSASDCLRIIDQAAAGRLSDEELETLVEELDRVRRKRAASEQLDSHERAIFDRAEQIVADVELAAAIEKRNRLQNIVVRERIREMARQTDATYGDPSLGLEAAMVGINAPIEGGRASVDAVANGLLRQTMGGMVADLRREGLIGVWNSRVLEREIARELWDLSLSKPTGKATDSKQAKAIAKIVHKYRKGAVERENRAGAYIRYRQGYVTRQSHDPRKLARDFDAWAEDVSPRLDWDVMNIRPEQRGEFLREAWAVLVSGRGLTAESDLDFAFTGPGNLAKKASASRVLLFKSADDWFDYNEKFGMQSLTEAVQQDFRRAAQNTALMQRFGTNPRAMFDTVRAELVETHKGDPEKVRRLESRRLDNQFAEIDGSVSHIQSYGLAGFGRGVRAIQSMAKLGGAFISSIADLAAVAGERRYHGRSLMESWGDALRAPTEGLSATDKRHFYDLLGVGIDGVLGDFMSRFSAQDDLPGRMSKTMALYFKLNLLGPWTDAVKRGVGAMMARDLAVRANIPLDALDEPTRRLLTMYGIDARKWEIARRAIVEGPDGKKYLMPGEIENVRGAPFTGLSERQQANLRDETAAALYAMFSDRTDFASPTAGARERAIMRQGLQAGTVPGEAIRFMMQFKAFPITVLTRVYGRDVYGHGAKTVRDALLRGEGDLLGLANYIAGATVLGYFAYQAKELAKGREPRQPENQQQAMQLFIASFLQGGGAGIYGDFLLGETSRFGGSLTDTLAGPAIGTISDLDQIRSAAMAGEDVWARIVRVAQSNTPFVNLFYTKAALDYLILFQMQEWANPGYLRRMERRMEREQNQRFLVPPSRAIPRGGGNRIFEGVR